MTRNYWHGVRQTQGREPYDDTTDYNPFASRRVTLGDYSYLDEEDYVPQHVPSSGPSSEPSFVPSSGPSSVQAEVEEERVELDFDAPSAHVPDVQPAHVASSHKLPLRRIFRTRGRYKAKKKFAEIGLAFLTNSPFLLTHSAHQRSIILVEYGTRNPLASELGQKLPEVSTDIQSQSPESSKPQKNVEIRSTVTEAPTPNPISTNKPTTSLRSYEVMNNEIALRQKVSDTRNKEPTGDVRAVHIQDDLDAIRSLFTDLFPVDFSRNRVNFCDWCIGDLANRDLPIRQTEFWRPVTDKFCNVIRTAFGIEYLVARQPVSELSRLSVAVSAAHNIQDSGSLSKHLPTSCLQKIAVFIQFNKRQGMEQRSFQLDKNYCLENYLIIFDKSHEKIATKGLIPGPKTWQNLVEDFDLVNQPSGNPIAFAIVKTIFEAVARKWSDFILCMDNYIAALEEKIYSQPANDRWSSALWSITKQISEAERLIKFHLLLMEDIQNSLLSLVETPFGPDWLNQDILDFKRLSNEIDESLKKPVANMIDLVYKSISIRDARQSLEINTSLWRLSWITFIFLPLTFLAGVFGMNVSEFRNDPSLKWYFIVAVPLMLLVLMSWFTVRNFMQRNIATQA